MSSNIVTNELGARDLLGCVLRAGECPIEIVANTQHKGAHLHLLKVETR
jgi:hypothetical protein